MRLWYSATPLPFRCLRKSCCGWKEYAQWARSKAPGLSFISVQERFLCVVWSMSYLRFSLVGGLPCMPLKCSYFFSSWLRTEVFLDRRRVSSERIGLRQKSAPENEVLYFCFLARLPRQVCPWSCRWIMPQPFVRCVASTEVVSEGSNLAVVRIVTSSPKYSVWAEM